MSKLILRTTNGDIWDVTFKLDKTVADFADHLQHQLKFPPKFKLIFNGVSLNETPEKLYDQLKIFHRLSACGLVNSSELIVTKCNYKTVFGIFLIGNSVFRWIKTKFE